MNSLNFQFSNPAVEMWKTSRFAAKALQTLRRLLLRSNELKCLQLIFKVPPKMYHNKKCP